MCICIKHVPIFKKYSVKKIEMSYDVCGKDDKFAVICDGV